MKIKKSRYLPILFSLSAMITVQLLTAATGTGYYLTQLTMTAYYTLAALGLCILMGYAGQVSLGQAGFFAVGGYTSAVLSTLPVSLPTRGFTGFLDSIGLILRGTDIYGNNFAYLSPWVAFIAALLFAGTAALLVGLPALRLKGHYLAMATLGFGIIVYRIVLGTHIFGEADGIAGVPPFPLAGPLTVDGDLGSRVENYYIAWGMVLLGLLLLVNLIHSRAGRALRSLHESEDASEAAGVNVNRYKLAVFITAALFTAAAGSLLTHFNGGIGPSEAGIMKSVRYVSIVALGGMANIWGTLAAGTVLNFLSLRGVFGGYDDAVFGLILVLVMIFSDETFIGKRIGDFFRDRNIFQRRNLK
ncbi:MAG: branched-chain amino acid ABC transporter permease [Spirochaetia bacterium]